MKSIDVHRSQFFWNITFVNRNRAEVIDVSFSSNSIWREIIDWRVSIEPSLSDHRIIRFRMTADPRVPKEDRNPV
jgi:hypothetical protein